MSIVEVVEMLFWAYPLTLCVGYVVSRIQEELRRQSNSRSIVSTRSLKFDRLIFWLHASICGSLGGIAIIAICIARQNGFRAGWLSESYLSAMIGVGLFYLAGILPDPDSPYEASQAQQHMWLISIPFEIAWLAYGIKIASQVSPGVLAVGDDILAALIGSRVLLFSLSAALFAVSHHISNKGTRCDPEESEDLLNGNTNVSVHYGTTQANGKHAGTKVSGDAQTTTWINYLLGFRKLLPFLWPADSKALQARAYFCFVLLVLQRLVNIATPHQLGVLVESLGSGKLPHLQICLYVLFRGLQGQQGVIGSFRALLWIHIGQSTYRRLSTVTFEHVLNLSLDFHVSKRIGEVTSALSKGSALNTFLDGFAFQLFPMVADLWIAAAYFFVAYNAFYAEMAIAVKGFYIYVTIYMAKYRGRARREMAKRERELDAARMEALLSYETVHHSSAVDTEMTRYGRLMSYFQTAERSVIRSLNLLNAVQNGVFTVAVLLACYLDAYEISWGLQDVARFVTLLTYLAQLQAPLNFFGSFYTQVQNNLVDAERMLELFNEMPTVTDRPGASELKSCDGEVTFTNVSFSYQGDQRALKDISFHIPAGTSAAIVGESGSGKSTILKLLYRFYDVDQGRIEVDGQPIQDAQLDSLRRHIAVVAQDTLLFNDTLLNNLLYPRPGASVEQVYQACRLASIHDKIIGSPDGYQTVVGERGTKLSGGERQRVAIARAILKEPRILLLDESTASLDTETESHIQASLDQLSRGRTTIMIAHRLSTVIKADQVLVLQRGVIVERGTHSELLKRNGVYAQMWNQQTETWARFLDFRCQLSAQGEGSVRERFD